jgi:small subunit ribosomal protein S2
MKPYIFTERSGIYILDLQRTLRELERAYSFARSASQRGGQILFVGTKKQAQEPIEFEAARAGQPYVTNRWLGGMLTNFVTMRSRVQRMEELEAMEADGRMAALPKKEQILLRKELGKLVANLNGVRDMRDLPAAIFVVDTKRENIAIAEARRLRIPIIGLVDTNADPDEVDYVIPGNDDAIRSVGLMCRVIAEAAIDGRGGVEAAIEAAPVKEAPAPAEAAPAVASEAADQSASEDVCAEVENPATELAEAIEDLAPEENAAE